jgi:hypothetical protein
VGDMSLGLIDGRTYRNHSTSGDEHHASNLSNGQIVSPLTVLTGPEGKEGTWTGPLTALTGVIIAIVIRVAWRS